MTRQPDARVMAIQQISADAAYLYGTGTYLGDFLRPGWDHPDELRCAAEAVRRHEGKGERNFNVAGYLRRKVTAGEMTAGQAGAEFRAYQERVKIRRARPFEEKVRELAQDLGANPLIQLDRGGFVWGCECWWGELGPGDAHPPRLQKYLANKKIIEVPAPHNTQPSEVKHDR